MEDTPDFYIGPPLLPEDLWFRETTISNLWDFLDREHGILSAPRRTGKTSIMDHLLEIPQHNFNPVKIFVQDIDHPSEFVLTLIDAFHDLHPALFRKIFASGSRLISDVLGRVGEIGVAGFKVAIREQESDWEQQWKSHGDEFFEKVRKSQVRTLFIVDEFPDMVLNMNRTGACPELVRPFLSWFRGHRLTPQPKKDSIRWLLGGSVNLASTLDSLNCLDSINDFHIETLPSFTREEIAEFVDRMLGGRGVDMADGFAESVAEKIGRPIPLFLQMLTQDLYRMWRKEKRTLTITDFDRAFRDLVVSSAAREKLQHYYSRIERYYMEPKQAAAYSILGKLSRSPNGFKRGTLMNDFERVLQEEAPGKYSAHTRKRIFNQLLRDLENDFYVAEISEDKYDFVSSLLKAWWEKYYA